MAMDHHGGGPGTGVTLTLPFLNETTPRFQKDDLDYHNLAKTLLETGRFHSTYRAPGYPAFVALVYAIFGPRPFAVYAVQCVLFAASLGIIAAVFGHITRSRILALTGTMLTACHPMFYAHLTGPCD